MSTGFTSEIEKGISFKKFAMNCARAFGACIEMRDDPHDKEIPQEFKPSDYHLRGLEDAKQELRSFEKMSFKTAKKQYLDSIKKRKDDALNSLEKKRELQRKYESMLVEIQNWVPPSSEHVNMKDFMIKQVTDSIEWDCSGDYGDRVLQELDMEVKQGTDISVKKWLAEMINSAQKKVKYHEEDYAKEVETCRKRTEWIQLLRDSLK